ncbi:unnamed protein product [Lampetra planeri]
MQAGVPLSNHRFARAVLGARSQHSPQIATTSDLCPMRGLFFAARLNANGASRACVANKAARGEARNGACAETESEQDEDRG